MRRIDWLAATLLLLFAAALRIIGLGFGGLNPDYFPSYTPKSLAHEQLPIHPDEYVMVATPVNMALRGTWNPNFFEYPALIFNVNRVLFTLTGSLDGYELADRQGRTLRVYAPHALYVLSRIWSLVGGMLQVACAYAMGRMLSGRYAALCAGLLVAVCFTLVQHGHYIKPGPLATGLMMLAAWAALAALRSGDARSRGWLYTLAGVATGLACATRYNAAAVAPLVVAVGLMLVYRHRDRFTRRGVLMAWAAMPLVFFCGSPYILRDFALFWRDFQYIVSQFTTTGANVAEYFLVDHLSGLGYIIMYTALLALGLPALGFAALSCAAGFRARHPILRSGLALIGGMTLLYAAVALRTIRPGHSDNLVMLILPFVAVLAAVGAGWLVERLPLSTRMSMPIVALLLIIQPLALSLSAVKMLSQPDTRHLLLDWAQAHIPPGARFFLNGPYNLPLDEALYPNTTQYVAYAPQLPSGADYDYMVYSDALAFDILRSHAIVPPEVIAWQRDYRAGLDAAYPRIAEIERPTWLGSQAMMNTASYWHNPGLVIYCLNDASCAEFR